MLQNDVHQEKSSAIEKAVDILKIFVPHNQPMGTIEISKKLGLHKATCSRILLTLVRKEFLSQDGDTRKFKLGRKALVIGRAALDSLNTALVQVSKPFLEKLSTQVNETVLLQKMLGTRSVVLYVAQENRAVRMMHSVGESVPLRVSVAGRAMLAFFPGECIRMVMDVSARAADSVESIVYDEQLQREFEDVRRRGYALGTEEAGSGVTNLAVPVYNALNEVVAAVVVSGPTRRIGTEADQELIAAVKNTAQSISGALQLQAVDG